MEDIIIMRDKSGGTAILTTDSPRSHYGAPILRIEAEDVNGDFGPADMVGKMTAADIIVGWASQEMRIGTEIEAVRKFLAQWPDGPQFEDVNSTKKTIFALIETGSTNLGGREFETLEEAKEMMNYAYRMLTDKEKKSGKSAYVGMAEYDTNGSDNREDWTDLHDGFVEKWYPEFTDSRRRNIMKNAKDLETTRSIEVLEFPEVESINFDGEGYCDWIKRTPEFDAALSLAVSALRRTDEETRDFAWLQYFKDVQNKNTQTMEEIKETLRKMMEDHKK